MGQRANPKIPLLVLYQVESFVHIYPGVQHGWTCRYNADDEQEVEKANEAHAKIVEWFGKFL